MPSPCTAWSAKAKKDVLMSCECHVCPMLLLLPRLHLPQPSLRPPRTSVRPLLPAAVSSGGVCSGGRGLASLELPSSRGRFGSSALPFAVGTRPCVGRARTSRPTDFDRDRQKKALHHMHGGRRAQGRAQGHDTGTHQRGIITRVLNTTGPTTRPTSALRSVQAGRDSEGERQVTG
jgi:hypothetical protein